MNRLVCREQVRKVARALRISFISVLAAIFVFEVFYSKNSGLVFKEIPRDIWRIIDKLILLPVAGIAICGILAFMYLRNDNKKFIKYLSLTIAIACVAFIYLFTRTYLLHTAEMERVIKQRGGSVTAIHRVAANKTPLQKSGSANTSYKVEYELNGATRTAWYRGINSLPDIHRKGRKAMEELWYFE